MADAVEVAIEGAFLAKARDFAAVQGLSIAMPNVVHTPPAAVATVANVTTYGKYLRPSFLPAPSFRLGISSNSHVQHYGLFRLDVFYGFGAGELAPKRIAAMICGYFKMDTEVSADGFSARVTDVPRIAPGLKDDPWWVVPVTIPYRSFERPTQ